MALHSAVLVSVTDSRGPHQGTTRRREATPRIGDEAMFSDATGILYRGRIMDIRPAPTEVGTWTPDASGYHRFEPAYPPGTRIAYIAVLGNPIMHQVDVGQYRVRRAGVWRAA